MAINRQPTETDVRYRENSGKKDAVKNILAIKCWVLDLNRSNPDFFGLVSSGIGYSGYQPRSKHFDMK